MLLFLNVLFPVIMGAILPLFRMKSRTLRSVYVMLVTCIDYPRDYAYRYVVLLERDGKLYDPALLDLFESDEKAADTENETTVSKQK